MQPPRWFRERLRAGPVAEDLRTTPVDGWRPAARSLEKRGLAERLAVAAATRAPATVAAHTPNAEQAAALDTLREADGFVPVLLEGITGSGKTEVYLQAIAERCLARGRQALVLVPEIGLTPPMLARFRARPGVPVHALHSGQSDGARAHLGAACAARAGDRGTRSAGFVPHRGRPDRGRTRSTTELQQHTAAAHARDFRSGVARRLTAVLWARHAIAGKTCTSARRRPSTCAGNAPATHPAAGARGRRGKRPLQAGCRGAAERQRATRSMPDRCGVKNRRGYAGAAVQDWDGGARAALQPRRMAAR